MTMHRGRTGRTERVGWTTGSLALLLLGGCAGGSESSASFGSPTQTNPSAAMTDAPTTAAETGVDSSTGGAETTGAGSTTGSTSDATTSDLTTDDPSAASTTEPPPPGCGNGVLDPLEECDDGNADDTDDCTSQCALATCGDGLVHAEKEACDAKGESADCNADCSPAACGDGIINAAAGEQCDGGGESADCNADCSPAACGDSIVNAAAGEQCDDGNDLDTDACVAGCKTAVCGDMFVQAGVEDCDDGNMVNGDGCENSCKKTPLPPECLNAALLSEGFRNVSNLAGPVGCDNPMVQQWYRFTGAAGVKMPTKAPPTSACGTHATGWINGTDPTVNDGAVARTVCFHWNGNVCNWSEPAMVRNCGDYFVYFLKNVSWGCSGRYCGTN